MQGMRYSSIRINSEDNASKLPVEGTLAFEVVNKGSASVFISEFDEVEADEQQCYGPISGFTYGCDLDFRFIQRSSTEYIILRRWYPVDDCK